MIAYKFDSVTKEYIGTQECQIDPLESELRGEKVYLTPANCVLTKPKTKNGFACVWNGEHWEYVEDHRGEVYWVKGDGYWTQPKTMCELGEFPEDSVITRPEKTKKEKLEDELKVVQDELRSYDYIGVKIAMGRATREEYKNEIERSNELAKRVNEINEELSNGC